MSQQNGFRHWHIERATDAVAWLRFDQAQSSANALGKETMAELAQVLTYLEMDTPKGLVVFSGKIGGFVAGADVHEFASLSGQDEALASIRLGQSILDRIEALSCPTVAMIHGHCLGGGLELALACDYRVATPDASLGLPEVMLGIHPGFGGTMRLPRLIGAPKAMELMLAGRTVRGRIAKRLGIVDHSVPPRHLRGAAQHMVDRRAAPRRSGRLASLASLAPLRPAVAWLLRRQVAKKAAPEHYPAPFALIDTWREHGGSERGMLDAEARSVARLITGATARNLTHLFFLRERLKSQAKPGPDKASNHGDSAENVVPPIRHVHVVGAGVMGGDIASWCAMRGLSVSLQDTRPEAIGKAIERATRLYRRRVREPRRIQAALERLTPDQSGAGVRHADVIIEAIVENAEAKQGLFQALEGQARADALLATNTSSIPLETIAETLAKPERLVGVHFFNPVAKMPLVEIVHGVKSSAEALLCATRFADAVDRLPLPVSSSPGFLVNRVLTPYMLEAVNLYAEGVSISSIDAAAKHFGMPMGPVLLADTVGLDICLSVAEILAERLGLEVPSELRAMVDKGDLGVKSGHGFYDHSGKVPKGPETVTGTARDGAEIEDRLILRLLNETVACLREGVVEDSDLLDAGMVFGTGFAPFRGGPMRYVQSEGKDRVVARLRSLEQRHGARYAPDPGWEMV